MTGPHGLARVLDVLGRPCDAPIAAAGGLVGAGRSIWGWAAHAVGLALGLPRRLEGMLDEVDDLLGATRRRIVEVDHLMDDVRAVCVAAARIACAVDATSRTADDLLARYEPAARDLAPVLDQVVGELTRARLDAAITLADQLPEVVGLVRSDVLPVLETLDQVAPDLHELVDLVRRGRQAADGLPGTDYLRRRGAAKHDQ